MMIGPVAAKRLICFLLVATSSLLSSSLGAAAALLQQELWCVAKNNAEDSALQGALDWACGAGGADCTPIQQGGPCYDPIDIQRTASYAFNNYYLKNGKNDDACFFSNTAALTSLNPSFGNCKFPSSKSVINGAATYSTGTGPASADLSGCSRVLVPFVWFWPIFHLLLVNSGLFAQCDL